MRRTSTPPAPATRRTRLAVASAALVLATGLAACSEAQPKPKFAEPSTSPTQEAKEETAEEFIRRWNDEQNRMLRGETAEWREMTRTCSSCIATADRVDEYYEAGGYVRTEGRKVLSVKPRGDEASTFRVRIDSAPTSYSSSAGSPEESLPGGISTYDVRLKSKDGAWVFVDYWEISQ